MNILCLFPFEYLDAVIQKRILKRLRKRIKFCGKSVVLSRGLMVERPEKLHIDDKVSLAANISIMGVGGGNGIHLKVNSFKIYQIAITI